MSPSIQSGFALRDPLPWDDFASLARSGEEMGYEAAFLPEIVGRDVFASLTALAGETRALRLASGVAAMVSRTTQVTAMAAATVQERSGGRAVLGLGAGPAVPGALGRLREEVTALRALLSGVEAGGVRLSLVPDPVVPIWLSALGPRAVRLAGEIADGVVLNCCTPERVARARTDVRDAAEAAGRDPDSVTVAVYVRSCIWEPVPAALLALRRAIGEYASFPAYARQFAAMGLGDEADAAARAHRDGRPDDVPESLIRRLCPVGDTAEARGLLEEFRSAGADVPVVYPIAVRGHEADSVRATLAAFAPSA